MAAAGNERHCHPVADLETHHAAAGGDDAPGKLVSRHMRQADIGIVSHPAVPVAAAEPACADRNDNAVLGRRRIGQGADFGRLFEGFVEHGFHRRLPLLRIRCCTPSSHAAASHSNIPFHHFC